MTSTLQRVALTIAGSDSGGGAGIQADLKTFARFGLFGTSVITAVTAQNTVGVRAWERVSPSLVRAQIDAVAEDLRPAAIKSGMLGDADVVRAVGAGVREHRLSPYVLDPVMVATSGDPLLEADAVEAIASELFPLATVVTPNLDEAALLVGAPVTTVKDMEEAARVMVERFGARAALVKGGHLDGPTLVDVFYDGSVMRRFTHARIGSTSTHGTGCTLSSAIAAHLAIGYALEDAIAESLDFVHRAIATAPALGAGHGPLNFFA
ncbi:MAG: bifunctional hydroxymethylpyrimidine kinase/phosphomethylpyrimidine kinase [bacterium]